MARRIRSKKPKRQTRYSILIVTTGTRTERLYLEKIRQEHYQKSNQKIEITIKTSTDSPETAVSKYLKRHQNFNWRIAGWCGTGWQSRKYDCNHPRAWPVASLSAWLDSLLVCRRQIDCLLGQIRNDGSSALWRLSGILLVVWSRESRTAW